MSLDHLINTSSNGDIILLSGTLQLTCCNIDTLNTAVGSLLEHISYRNTPKLNASMAGVWEPLLGSRASGAAYTGFPAFTDLTFPHKIKGTKVRQLGKPLIIW